MSLSRYFSDRPERLIQLASSDRWQFPRSDRHLAKCCQLSRYVAALSQQVVELGDDLWRDHERAGVALLATVGEQTQGLYGASSIAGMRYSTGSDDSGGRAIQKRRSDPDCAEWLTSRRVTVAIRISPRSILVAHMVGSGLAERQMSTDCR